MKRAQGGFAYLAVMFLAAALAIAALALAGADRLANIRSKERALLAIGAEYRAALQRYHQAISPHVYPQTVAQLLEDRRGGTLRRHLRKAYVDPVSPGVPFELVLEGGRIVGVRSASEARPLKLQGFDPNDSGFAGAEHYRDWIFLASGVPAAR